MLTHDSEVHRDILNVAAGTDGAPGGGVDAAYQAPVCERGVGRRRLRRRARRGCAARRRSRWSACWRCTGRCCARTWTSRRPPPPSSRPRSSCSSPRSCRCACSRGRASARPRMPVLAQAVNWQCLIWRDESLKRQYSCSSSLHRRPGCLLADGSMVYSRAGSLEKYALIADACAGQCGPFGRAAVHV